MTRALAPLLFTLALGLLTGCPAQQPAPQAQTPGQAPPAAPPSDTQAAPADPAKLITATVENEKPLSVHNSMGDRVNLEKPEPWPVAMTGKNSWSFSFKPSETAPMELTDHLTIEVTKVGDEGNRLGQSYSGGQRGGTLSWTGAGPGEYIFRTIVKRKGEETGPIEFHLLVTDDGSSTDEPAEEATNDVPVKSPSEEGDGASGSE